MVSGISTVTTHWATASPHWAVMVAVPLPAAVTMPVAPTLATVSSLEVNCTGSVQSSGSTAARSCSLSPAWVKVSSVLLRLSFVARTDVSSVVGASVSVGAGSVAAELPLRLS